MTKAKAKARAKTPQHEEVYPESYIPPEPPMSPEEKAREKARSRIINLNLEKAFNMEEVQSLLDECEELLERPENADIDIVFTMLFEINHELISRGFKIDNAGVPDEILKQATIAAATSITNDLKNPHKWYYHDPIPGVNVPGIKTKSKEAPAPVDSPKQEPAKAETANDIKAQVLKASSFFVPFDPVSRKLLTERPKASPEPQTFVIETFKGKPASKGHKAVPPGIVQLTLGLDNESLQESFPDGAPVHIFGNFEYFDFRVSLAMYALWNRAIEMGIPKDKIYFSIAEICRNMTSSKSSPSSEQGERVCNSAEKLMFLKVRIDTSGEAHLRNHSNTKIAAFLPAELEIGRFNGNKTALIHPLKEMPVYAFARERGQFTTIPAKVFNESPLSLTETNMQIEYYLLTRVCKMNYSGEWEPTILIDTFLEECEILPPAKEDKAASASYRQRKRRALIAAEKWLEHLGKHGIINGFEKGKDRFTITPKNSKTKRIATQKKK